jgi:hypothetical protein
MPNAKSSWSGTAMNTIQITVFFTAVQNCGSTWNA